jgi:hypothetical protein
MPEPFAVYCDESCHLEHDLSKVMILGAVWCPTERSRAISLRLRDLKRSHGLGDRFEAKWVKVSPSKLAYYIDLVDYFFSEKDLHFRAVIIPDKSQLEHEAFGQTHDEWYYKMYFTMLQPLIETTGGALQIYIDVKDTHANRRAQKLHEVLCNSQHDFSREVITRVQVVASERLHILQLGDILIGAVAYANRHLQTSEAKLAVVEALRRRAGLDLLTTTAYRESKVNLLRWQSAAIGP